MFNSDMNFPSFTRSRSVQKTFQKRSEFPEFHSFGKQGIPGNMTQENVQKMFKKRSEILVGITSQDSRMAPVPLEILFAGWLLSTLSLYTINMASFIILV